MTILKIDTSSRVSESNSRVITQYLTKCLNQPVICRDLGKEMFPAISADDFLDMHNNVKIDRQSLKQHQKISDELIAELMNVDVLVLGVPIYNFGVPQVLKQWIDYVVKSGITFKYVNSKPVGLCNIERAFIVTSSGGTIIGSEMDYASSYMETICKFIGIDEVHHIKANGSKGSVEKIINDAIQQVDDLLVVA